LSLCTVKCRACQGRQRPSPGGGRIVRIGRKLSLLSLDPFPAFIRFSMRFLPAGPDVPPNWSPPRKGADHLYLWRRRFARGRTTAVPRAGRKGLRDAWRKTGICTRRNVKECVWAANSQASMTACYAVLSAGSPHRMPLVTEGCANATESISGINATVSADRGRAIFPKTCRDGERFNNATDVLLPMAKPVVGYSGSNVPGVVVKARGGSKFEGLEGQAEGHKVRNARLTR
jgi:hypothetical protein